MMALLRFMEIFKLIHLTNGLQKSTQNAPQDSSPFSTTLPPTTSPGARYSLLSLSKLHQVLHPWCWRSCTRCQKLAPPHGLRTSCFWPMRRRLQLPTWWVGWCLIYLTYLIYFLLTARTTGPWPAAQEDAHSLSKTKPTPAEQYHRLQPDLHCRPVRLYFYYFETWNLFF